MTTALTQRESLAIDALVHEQALRTSAFAARNVKDQIDVWKGHLGRDLNKFEQMVVARPFRWSGNHWTRLIKPVWEGNPRGYVEIDVVPPQGKTWDDLKELRIYHTLVSIDKADVMLHALPENIKKDLYANVGNDLAPVLLYGNLFPCIDWEAYRLWAYRPDYNNKGVPFEMCTTVLSDEHMEG
jgi:hypothetical protein